jgi:DinB family protein
MERDILAEKAMKEGVTAAERGEAARHLAATRDSLVETLAGLSDAQWRFKPSSERWSIAEIMEHIAIVEDRIGEIIGKMGEAPADSVDRDAKQVDAFVLANVPDRTRRVQAPERLAPSGRWTGSEALEHFLGSRVRTEELLRSAPHLRGRVLPHPILGPWDGYQWILGVGAHCARHTSQIREVMADPNFPAV